MGKKRIVVGILMMLFCGFVRAQDLPDLQVQDVDGNEISLAARDGRWLLLTASEAGCSFTYTGVKNITELASCENLDIIVFDYESADRVKEIYEEFLDKAVFVSDKEATNNAFRKQYSPQFQLYNPSGKLVWKAKGLKKLDVEEIRAEIDCTSRN